MPQTVGGAEDADVQGRGCIRNLVTREEGHELRGFP